jgi:hypothetical protein
MTSAARSATVDDQAREGGLDLQRYGFVLLAEADGAAVYRAAPSVAVAQEDSPPIFAAVAGRFPRVGGVR